MELGVSHTLEVRGLQVERGSTPVLRGLDLDVAPGELVALMGESGAGKSTALRAIIALEPFSAGSVRVGDFQLAPGPVPPESRLRALRRSAGMVFQAHSLFEHLPALENVTLALVHAVHMSPERARERAMSLLESLGVAHRATALPRQLSGGEAQRVGIARALALDPRLLLMDEPTAALDPQRRDALGRTLRALAADGRALLVATHDLEFARSWADRVIVLERGVAVREGPAAAVLSDD
jgi:ABC-type polar amino acid transport system ATPase subunit